MSWQTVKIEDITEVVTKGTTPTTYGMPFTDEGINFIKAEALNGDSALDHDGFTFVSEDTHQKLARSILKKDDVLVTIAGANVGRCGFVREHDLPANTNQAVGIVRVDQSKAEPRFVYYYFKHPSMRAKCLNIGGQAAQPNVNLGNLKSFDVPLPDRSTQKRIASILSAYDNLIENNRRRTALLEEAARLLYREWFVHFRFPGHEHVKIVDGVPEGWEVKQVGDLLARQKSKPKVRKDEYQDVGTYPCVDQGQEFVGGYTDNAEAIYSEELPLIVFGDHTRALKFVNFPFARGADGTQLCKSNDPRLSQELFYWALVNVDLSNYFYARHFKFLKDQEVVIPASDLADQFTEFAKFGFDQIRVLRQQSIELAKARDLLLPRLMDGRLEVAA